MGWSTEINDQKRLQAHATIQHVRTAVFIHHKVYFIGMRSTACYTASSQEQTVAFT